ncbi:MAG: type II secretion system protein N [Dokdonella sp.]|uniref:type II secretion system protein N n=1 Tax=Dokdonella sp. TaxID=2291710 RepID=UPI002B5D30B0|nr:type II secretion system protein N [Dokdonella sp.]HOX71298.1 type II secretion system protein N [Dokdonella sp.]HPG94473.1 type II secretion system protein N [Dokdonella sp.]HPN78711.1 type II secretion system protein N [Dokdonella sp.]
MKAIKWFFILLVIALVVAGVVAWTLPADVAYRHLASRLGPVSLIGIRGTVWDGHADGVSVFGRDLGELDWRIDKAPLLMRSVHADLRIRGADIDTSGLLERNASGDIHARDVRFRVPASLFAPALDVPSLKLLGSVSGTFSRLVMVDGLVTEAGGSAQWSDAGVSGTAEARFSDILAEFATRPDGSIGGTLADDGNGNLEVNGTFSIAATGFQAEAFLSARENDPRILEALRYIGQPQADGSSHLLISGQLFRLY